MPRSLKKRSLSTAGEKPPSKRHVNHRRFLSPPSSDEETQRGDESDITISQKFGKLLPIRPALWDIEAMIRWNLQADVLRQSLSMSNRVGKEKSSKKGIQNRAAGGLASNTSFDGNSPGWTVLVS